MKLSLLNIVFFLVNLLGFSQIKNTYNISFPKANHHEALITAQFSNLESGPVAFTMSKSVPQSLNNHLFFKNVFNFKATNGKGNLLKVTQNSLTQWTVSGHEGIINISYNLFANKGDGIHSIISEKMALINPHSTFIYVQKLASRPIEVNIKDSQRYNWKIATQLEFKSNTTFRASDLDTFLDSPILLSNHKTKEFRADVYGTEYTFELNFYESYELDDTLFNYLSSNLTKVIEQQKNIFGSYPNFKNNKYTFIIAVGPSLINDNKPHKNSSVITHGINGNVNKEIMTALIENFLGSWNSKRMIPTTQAPFEYSQFNLAEELWFSEGLTSYYADLILLRSGLISKQEYLDKVAAIYNTTWVSSVMQNKNILNLSKLAPLSASTEFNRNLYISYTDYGYMIALALDLSLRELKENLNLDNFLQLFWTKYGKTETAYNIDNIFATLKEYSEKSFADNFFEEFIFKSNQPKYDKLFESVGIDFKNKSTPYTGLNISYTKNRLAIVSDYPVKYSPAYNASIEKGDTILSIDNETFSDNTQLDLILGTYKIGKKVKVVYKRLSDNKFSELELSKNPNIELSLKEKPNNKALTQRGKWLEEK